jgi:hypothetical protein
MLRLTFGFAAMVLLMTVPASAQVGLRIGGIGIGLGVPTGPILRDRPERVERYRAPQRSERTQRRNRKDDDDDVKTAKKTPASEESKFENENSSVASLAAPKVEPSRTETGNENSSIAITPTDQATRKTAIVNNEASKPEPGNENSTIASLSSTPVASVDPVKGQLTKSVEHDKSGNVVLNCRRYFPTVGQTISVPCD